MKIDSIITKNGGSFYALIPSEVKDLFVIENGHMGEIEIVDDGIIITFKLKEKIDNNDEITKNEVKKA